MMILKFGRIKGEYSETETKVLVSGFEAIFSYQL
jgi:hypothetical protein